MEIVELRAIATQFEDLLAEALRRKYMRAYGPNAAWVLEHNTLLRWSLADFIDRYVNAAVYPVSSLDGAVFRLMDVKLQLYYIQEVDIGLYNRLIYDDPAYSDLSDLPPDLLMRRLSFDQNLIGKSRVLWERLMQAIYFIEHGRPVEGRSIKGRFFRWAKGDPKWAFLEPYEAVIERYDERLRTPEFHKGSILRKELLGGTKTNPNELLELVNRATNVIWENLSSIVGGGDAVMFTDLHELGLETE